MNSAVLMSTAALAAWIPVGAATTIAGTGASQTLLRSLTATFSRANPDCPMEVPDSVGSRGGIRALLAGKAELARVSRPLKKAERSKGLVYRSFAATRVVFVLHPSVAGVDRITEHQLIGIYRGEIGNWSEVGGPDHRIFAMTRDGGTTLKTVLKALPAFRDAQTKPKATYSSLETRELMQAHPYTIGFLPATLVTGTTLKILEIDGIDSPESSGAPHPLALELGIVSRGPLSACSEQFFSFLSTPEAHEDILRNHSVPARAAAE